MARSPYCRALDGRMNPNAFESRRQLPCNFGGQPRVSGGVRGGMGWREPRSLRRAMRRELVLNAAHGRAHEDDDGPPCPICHCARRLTDESPRS